MTDPRITGPRPRRGFCLVVAAPSGAGKTSITRAVLAAETGLRLSISATTRAPRAGERDGVDYFFRTPAAFETMITEGALLEWAEVFGRRYGTPREAVITTLARGEDVLFDIDWQGYRQLRAALPGDVVGVFVLPPGLADLEARLVARGDAPTEIARRMAAARREISHCQEFDYIVMNDALPQAIAAVRAILHAGRAAVSRQLWLATVGDR